MSTRSGKRIHGYFEENTEQAEPEVFSKNERKTRSKKLKENSDCTDVTVSKSKKKKHYVTYPSEELTSDTASNDVIDKPRQRRNVLQEQNVIAEVEVLDSNANETVRLMRHTKKFADNESPKQELENPVPEKGKGKKNKKKKSKDSVDNKSVNRQEESKVKKSKKKKKGKQSTEKTTTCTVLNGSQMSVDSFHSAAGSPLKVHNDELMVTSTNLEAHTNTTLTKTTFINNETANGSKNTTRKRKRSIRNAFDNNTLQTTLSNVQVELLNNTFDTSKKSKSSINIDADIIGTPDQKVDQSSQNNTFETNHRRTRSSIKDTTFDKDTYRNDQEDTASSPSTSYKKDKKSKRKSSIKNDTFEKDIPDSPVTKEFITLNGTYDKIDTSTRMSIKDTTFEKEPSVSQDTSLVVSVNKVNDAEKLNTTFEMPLLTRKSSRSNNSSKEMFSVTNSLNNSYVKSDNNEISLDISEDKYDIKLDSTFDKEPKKADKSSLISSDASNATYDKEGSRISITSDESNIENIVNTTPLLIESSIDESRLSKKSLDLDKSPLKDSSPVQMKTDELKPPITPLKREGTFTKESPEIINVSIEKTPTKRKSFSPGSTPFPAPCSSQRTILNVTRSLEKSRRSSLAETVPRQTRVMFCSPGNNPAVVTQQRKTVIKSSLKGSNKSFVFDESAFAARAGARKRSYTQSDAEETRAKRKRLAGDLLSSVTRLSRPRTSSATAKLDSTTPTKKPVTPLKLKAESKRTKLPNFAALHKKEFDKMESLTDCQQRKRQRAKQLLTPTGAITVLERSSPKGPIETAKPKETAAVKKTDTPKLTKLPTLESLRPGFTRFGFKMNTEFNPFSIPSQDSKKVKDKSEISVKASLPPKTPVQPTPEVLLPRQPATEVRFARQPTLPSLNGTTRREAAKQTIMREKSFTSLSGKRDVTRNESRTIIKGVRTNRRFELQMKMRNII